MELIHDEISNEIIETARALTKEKNIKNLTVRDILKAMNLTNRVFYNRFHNIEEVLDILYRESVDKVREGLFLPFHENEDFFAYIMKIGQRILQLSYESRQHMSQFVFETDSGSSANYDWWCREILKLIKKGKQIGYLRCDLDDSAVCYAIWCFIRGFNTDALSRDLPLQEASALFRYGFGCLLAGLKT